MGRDEISRRRFLALLGAAGGAAALGWPQAARAGAARVRAGSVAGKAGNVRVVILGGGLSGLCAAYNLLNSGADVVVLEAADVVGGRVKTVRRPFVNGGYAEAGAVRIFDGHAWTLKYVHEFGLGSKLVELPDGNKLWYLSGRRFVTPPSGQPWPVEGMSDEERADPMGAVERHLAAGFAEVGDVADPAWPRPYPGALELDRFRLGDWLRDRGATQAWIRFLAALEGNLLDTNTAQIVGREKADRSTRTFTLQGGNDQLPKAFAAALGERVHLGATVERVDNHDSAVTVAFRDRAGRRQQLTADFCVCTIPFPVLRRLRMVGFDHEKMRAIREFRLAPAGRVQLQTRQRFWEHDPLGRLSGLRMIGTDTRAERIWNTSATQAGPEGMLQAYLFADNAEALRAVPSRRRVKAITTEMETVLPGISRQVVASYVKLWAEDPLAGGAFASAQPGQLSWILGAARRPVGRTHFAGEHTVVRVAWMNGALQSGERAAQEILSRVQQRTGVAPR